MRALSQAISESRFRGDLERTIGGRRETAVCGMDAGRWRMTEKLDHSGWNSHFPGLINILNEVDKKAQALYCKLLLHPRYPAYYRWKEFWKFLSLRSHVKKTCHKMFNIWTRTHRLITAIFIVNFSWNHLKFWNFAGVVSFNFSPKMTLCFTSKMWVKVWKKTDFFFKSRCISHLVAN